MSGDKNMSDTNHKKIYTIKLKKSIAPQNMSDNCTPQNNNNTTNSKSTNDTKDKSGYDSDEEIKKYISDYIENGEPAENGGRLKYKSKKSKSGYTYDIFDAIDPKLFDEKMKEFRTKRPELFTITVEEYREYRKKMYPNYPQI
jgi:hypothetical protein